MANRRGRSPPRWSRHRGQLVAPDGLPECDPRPWRIRPYYDHRLPGPFISVAQPMEIQLVGRIELMRRLALRTSFVSLAVDVSSSKIDPGAAGGTPSCPEPMAHQSQPRCRASRAASTRFDAPSLPIASDR